MIYKRLTRHIAESIKEYHKDHRDLTIEQVLQSLEELRFKLTEDLVRIRVKQ